MDFGLVGGSYQVCHGSCPTLNENPEWQWPLFESNATQWHVAPSKFHIDLQHVGVWKRECLQNKSNGRRSHQVFYSTVPNEKQKNVRDDPGEFCMPGRAFPWSYLHLKSRASHPTDGHLEGWLQGEFTSGIYCRWVGINCQRLVFLYLEMRRGTGCTKFSPEKKQRFGWFLKKSWCLKLIILS